MSLVSMSKVNTVLSCHRVLGHRRTCNNPHSPCFRTRGTVTSLHEQARTMVSNEGLSFPHRSCRSYSSPHSSLLFSFFVCCGHGSTLYGFQSFHRGRGPCPGKQLDCVEALVAAKCNIGAGAVDDMNALHFAAQKGHLEVCRFLLNQGTWFL